MERREDLDQTQRVIACLEQLFKSVKNQMNCGDKDDEDGDGDIKATSRVKGQSMEKGNLGGSSSGGGISTLISQE